MKRVIGFSLMALTVQLGSASELVKLTPEQQARAGTETAAVEMAAFGSRLPTAARPKGPGMK